MLSIFESLGLNSTLFAQIVSFLVLLWVLRRWVFGPIRALMDERADRVAKSLEDAENQREEAVRLQQEAARALQEARAEARRILEQAERTANARAQEILDEAKAQAERQLEQAKESIRRERDQALAELRKEVADLALEVAAKVLGQTVDDRIQRDLVHRFVEEVGSAR